METRPDSHHANALSSPTPTFPSIFSRYVGNNLYYVIKVPTKLEEHGQKALML